MNPLVSVLICTYERKKLVSRAIKSAIAQEGINLEVIVVDDCSNDGTYEYLVNEFHCSSKINIFRTKRNSGVSHATNLAFQYSSGDYIALLGDDDYWIDVYKLAKQINIMKTDSQIGICGTWWIEVGEYDRKFTKQPKLPNIQYKLIERILMRGGVFGGSTSVLSRNAWTAVDGMDEEQVRGTDSDLFRRIILHGYSANILHEVSTYVDAAHGLTRMTSMNEMTALRRHLKAHSNVLKKHLFVYILYPRALFARLFSMIRIQLVIWSKQLHHQKL